MAYLLLQAMSDGTRLRKHINTSLSGVTNLFLRASTEANLHILKLLLDAGCEVNAETESGSTALHYAASYGNVRVVKKLLEVGALNGLQENTHGRTPLMLACHKGHERVVQVMIDSDPSWYLRRDKSGNDALMLAIVQNNLEIAKVLLEFFGIVWLSQMPEPKLGKPYVRRRPYLSKVMQKAAECDMKDVVKLLLQYGADRDSKVMSEFGPRSLLWIAVKSRAFKVTKLLLSEGATISAVEAQEALQLKLSVHSRPSVNSRDIEHLVLGTRTCQSCIERSLWGKCCHIDY